MPIYVNGSIYKYYTFDIMIWGFPKKQLGDRWAHLNRIIKCSNDGLGKIYFDNQSESEIKKVKSLWDLIDTDIQLEFVYENNINFKQAEGVVEFPFPYYKTKKQWLDSSQKKYDICYQTHTNLKSANWLPIKNFTENDKNEFERKIKPFFTTIELGKNDTIPIEEEINIMLNSKIFVGICSGLSHIAHSVGIPVFLKKFENDYNNSIPDDLNWVKFIENFHPNKNFSLFSNIDELIYKIKLFELFTNKFPKLNWKFCPLFQIGVSERNILNYNEIFIDKNINFL